jgi:hypothetical protein
VGFFLLLFVSLILWGVISTDTAIAVEEVAVGKDSNLRNPFVVGGRVDREAMQCELLFPQKKTKGRKNKAILFVALFNFDFACLSILTWFIGLCLSLQPPMMLLLRHN